MNAALLNTTILAAVETTESTPIRPLRALLLLVLSISLLIMLIRLPHFIDERQKIRDKKLEIKLRKMEAQAQREIEEELYGKDSSRIAEAIVTTVSSENTGKSSDTRLDAAQSDAKARMSMAQIKCAQCGAPIDEEANFCKYCGTKVPEMIQKSEVKASVKLTHINQERIRRAELEHDLEVKKMQQELEAKRIQQKEKEAKRKHTKTVLILLLSLMILLIIVIASIDSSRSTYPFY